MLSRYSFGTGTQALPIPELMPFRLTRQMCGVLAPHDARAALAGPMAATLQALRSGAHILEVWVLLLAPFSFRNGISILVNS